MNRKVVGIPNVSFYFTILTFISLQILNCTTASIPHDQEYVSFLSLTKHTSSTSSKRRIQSSNGVNEQSFRLVIENFASIALELKDEVLSTYSSNEKCTSIMSECINGNYEHCISTFPNPTCVAKSEYSTVNSVCENFGSDCPTKIDHTASTVRNLPSVDVTSIGDPKMVDAICRSKALDKWFVQKYDELKELRGILPTSMYVGFSNGVFRIYPGRSSQSKDCRGFDPTLRPWYSAATGGKKTVVLMLDTSNTMGESSRLDEMKKAARQVIGTASVADRFAVVPFDDNPRNPTRLLKASSTNKKQLTDIVNTLNVSTGVEVNYATAFDYVIKVLLAEAIGLSETECSVAILLFTDGETNKVNDALREIQSIQSDIQDLKEQLGRGEEIFLFAYSMSRINPSNHNFTSCTESSSFRQGLWSQVDDQLTGVNELEMIPFLKNFYELFQWGIQNENYTDTGRIRLVEPYPFYTFGSVGTTISVPVYVDYFDERTNTTIKILGGVVGVDGTVAVFDTALNISTDDSTESINRIVGLASNQYCPDMSKISPCDLDFYRQNNNQVALCSKSCTNVLALSTNSTNNSTSTPVPSLVGFQTCVNESDAITIPLWKNDINANKPDIERLCCSASGINQCSIQESNETQNPTGSSSSSGVSPPSSSPTTDGGGGGLTNGAIAGISIAVAVLVVIVFFVGRQCRNNQDIPDGPGSQVECVQSQEESQITDDQLSPVGGQQSQVQCQLMDDQSSPEGRPPPHDLDLLSG